MSDLVYRTATQSDADPFEYVLSDETVDRMGEVINADGWDLDDFKSGMKAPLLLNHNPNAIIGRWENLRVQGKRLLGKMVFARKGLSQLADEMRGHWEDGNIRAVSVGFKSLKREPLTKDADAYAGPFRYLRQRLMECSLVSVPANQNALPVLRSYPLSPEISRQIFGKTASQDQPVSRVSANPLSKGRTSMNTPLTKQIENQQSEITRLRDRLVELSGVVAEDRDEDQVSLVDTLPGMIEDAAKELGRLQKMERVLGFSATASQDPEAQAVVPESRRPFALPRKKIEPVDYVFRAAAAGMRACADRVPVEHVIREVYGSDENMQIIMRAAVLPATTTVTGYAAELVQVGFGAFLDRLLAGSIYQPLSAAGARYDLGRNGTLKIPYRAATPTASGAWVGEGLPKPVKKIGLSTVTLTPHKISCITAYTEEMAMSSVPAVEGILRKAMADDTQASLDGFLIDAVAESAIRPAGLLVGVTPITASVLTTSLEKIVADINALIAPMEAAGGGGNIVLLMNPAQARKIGMAMTSTGDFAFGSPDQAAAKFGVSRIIQSTTIAAGRVIAVDADWFATATGDQPRFAVSQDATLHMEDTTPLAIGTAGSPATVAAPAQNMFQTDSIAIRLSVFVTWAMVRTAMVQTIAAVTW
jgi:HK97 family phage prohead protease/HK97 family phage major capsid protein